MFFVTGEVKLSLLFEIFYLFVRMENRDILKGDKD